jgi:uncharacterized protein YfbU (UPF0304 family)
MQLSLETRWILTNQYRLLERLDPDAGDECRQAIRILEHGYELEYSALTESFLDPMSEDECLEVYDILDMHRQLCVSYDNLADKSGLDENAISFRGFDGNNETTAFVYARFLIGDLGKWTELAGAGDHLNSHAPVIDGYRRMLEVWRQLRAGRDTLGRSPLTAEEMKRISQAAWQSK